MSYIHPLAAEYLRKRWTRHDAHRFAPPGSPEAKMPGEWRPRTALASAAEADAADEASWQAEIAALRASHERVRAMLAEVKSEVAWRRFVRKSNPDQPRVPAGNPDGGQWTSGGGGRDRTPATEMIAQARRGGRPIQPLSPAQQLRLDLATARAQEAVARVQQLDPNWRPAQSLTDPNSGEGLIRAREETTREAEARFIALSRAGKDEPYPMRDAPTTAEVLAPGGLRVGSRDLSGSSDIRTVTADEFEAIRIRLMAGARHIEADPDYAGVWYKRPDDSVFGLRLSTDSGLTLDVVRSTDPSIRSGFRIHQR